MWSCHAAFGTNDQRVSSLIQSRFISFFPQPHLTSCSASTVIPLTRLFVYCSPTWHMDPWQHNTAMLYSQACASPIHKQDAACYSSGHTQFKRPIEKQGHHVWRPARRPPRSPYPSSLRCTVAGSLEATSGLDRASKHLHSDRLDMAAMKVGQRLASLSRSAAAIALAGILLTGCTTDAAYAKSKLTQDEQLTVDLFKRNTPSVVFITNLAVRCAPRPQSWVSERYSQIFRHIKHWKSNHMSIDVLVQERRIHTGHAGNSPGSRIW